MESGRKTWLWEESLRFYLKDCSKVVEMQINFCYNFGIKDVKVILRNNLTKGVMKKATRRKLEVMSWGKIMRCRN